jgi:glycosidase
MKLRFLLLTLASLALSSACSDDAEPPGTAGFGGGSGNGGTGGSGGSGGTIASSCSVSFRFKPEAGTTASCVAIAGEWNAFDAEANMLTGPDGNGEFTGTLDLAPGNWGYKLVLDGQNWILDPNQGYREYVDGQENSALRVHDCGKPALSVTDSVLTTSGYTATLAFQAAKSGAAIDTATATLRSAGTETPISDVAVDGTNVTLALTGLSPGKYTANVSATDDEGQASEPLRLVFWIEPERFEWQDALIYMIVTDRYDDGDPSNDPGPTAGVQDPRGDWKGGDLEGVRQKIADGTLDQLGIRAIWLTPFQTNPTESYLASDGVHKVTGYHGYWPTKAREVDPRIGGEAALHALVKEAHAHGIRILMDYVVNHVHEAHEYFAQHPDWFRTGCVCGTSGCDWTAQRLECLFTPYLPDVNWTVPAVSEQFEADAVWWLDTFDLDGLRVDAVKHVEDAAIRNISTRVTEEFEAAGTRYFLMGETAMGWSDCGVDCNQDQYGTISNYIGPHALDGQFDFVLYHGVPYRVFAYDTQGMLHADFWAQQSLIEYPKDAIMTPFIGSHDSSRFVTLATYRGQPGWDQGVPGNQWDNVAVAPPDSEPYQRHALALSWLLGLPGAPLLYYGDEYGEWGGADPGNRAMWRGDGTLSADENSVLARTRKLGAARKELVALRRGNYRSLYATETFLAFSRETESGDVAVVALSRDPNPTTTEVVLPATFPLSNGTQLKDRLGGANVTITTGKLSIPLPGRGAAILAP